MGKLRDLQPGFAELVKSGAFKKRSVALYNDLAGRGPYLRHLGLLGAQPPEVKGLAEVKFQEGAFQELSIDDCRLSIEEEPMDRAEIKKTVVESVKEFFAELFGNRARGASEGQWQARSASEGFSDDQVEATVDAAVAKAVNAVEAKFTEKVTTLDTDLKAAETELAEMKGQAASGSRQPKIQ